MTIGIQALFIFWLLYAVPAVLLSLPIVALSWSRVHWRFWELLIFVLPIGVWLALSYLIPEAFVSKGISNIGEPFLVALMAPLFAGIRVFATNRLKMDERRFAAILQIIACAVAAAVYLFIPNLGGHL